MTDLTDDAFLGGRLNILQPRKGYRAGIDPVLLAASVPARPDDWVLDLGCGVGTGGLCLSARVNGLSVVGVELQEDLADLARENFRRNALAATIHTSDIVDLPTEIRMLSFDHVMANPPFFDRAHGSGARDLGRDLGRGGATPLAVWVDVATRRLKPRGYLTLILRAERLPELMRACDTRLGDIVVQPISARHGRHAELVLLSARKGARGSTRLAYPFVLHEGETHDSDRDSYTEAARTILRDGAAMADVALTTG